ncbi:MAG: flagellar capping protein, partial [Acetatifactor sp.]|nr:flagellar capping protein [Acetatifactor sp.]
MSAILNTIHNHYLTTYAPSSVTRYDTHKKSELRAVYNSIVKLNKESPWYLPVKNMDVQQSAIGLKESARDLHNTI